MKLSMEVKEYLAENGYTQDKEGLEAYVTDIATEYGVRVHDAWNVLLLLGVDELADGFINALEDMSDEF